jgi:hypothetical protein
MQIIKFGSMSAKLQIVLSLSGGCSKCSTLAIITVVIKEQQVRSCKFDVNFALKCWFFLAPAALEFHIRISNFSSPFRKPYQGFSTLQP